MKIRTNNLEFEVDVEGPATAPAVMLIMGLGMQMVAWPSAFVAELLADGYRVIRFDNRDIGLSEKTTAQTPNLIWQAMRFRLGLSVRSAYTLREMTDDTKGILDALDVDRCHVIGVSMGGMIAQGLASHYPTRVQTLTSIMSTTGARGLPQATAKATMALLSRPRSQSLDDLVEHFAKTFRIIGSPGFPIEESELKARIALGLKRSYHPAGTIKQLAAILASGDRSAEVRAISVPTLVLHGRDDPLVPLKNGEDTAQKIRGAKFHAIAGMGHDLAPGVVVELMKHVKPFLNANTLR
jgi:pimeloyl-ACP methyl ester carboxylesterase